MRNEDIRKIVENAIVENGFVLGSFSEIQKQLMFLIGKETVQPHVSAEYWIKYTDLIQIEYIANSFMRYWGAGDVEIYESEARTLAKFYKLWQEFLELLMDGYAGAPIGVKALCPFERVLRVWVAIGTRRMGMQSDLENIENIKRAILKPSHMKHVQRWINFGRLFLLGDRYVQFGDAAFKALTILREHHPNLDRLPQSDNDTDMA